MNSNIKSKISEVIKLGSKVHSPFLWHLFVCCGENYQDFVSEINAKIEMQIEEQYEIIHDNIKKRKIINDRRSIIPSRFRNFVEGKQKCHDKRNSKYCMVEFFKEIVKINQELRLSQNESNAVNQADIDILESFKKEFDYYRDKDAEAVNDKRLRSLLRQIKERKMLNNDQEYLFEYLLKMIFPEYKNGIGESLVERIKFKSWEEVAFGKHEHSEIIKVILENDVRYEQVHKLLNKFYVMKKYDTEKIRKLLVQISTLLDEIYEDIRDDKVTQDESSYTLIEYDPIEEGRISELHSHIVAFMRWIPMMPQDKPNEKMMEAVDSVIDQIRIRACEIIDGKTDLKRCLSTYPSSWHDIIFMQDDGEELRRLLINAMFHDPDICLQFQHFYGKEVSISGKGGED